MNGNILSDQLSELSDMDLTCLSGNEILRFAAQVQKMRNLVAKRLVEREIASRKACQDDEDTILARRIAIPDMGLKIV